MSIVCKRGHQVPAGSRFCLQCGEPLPIAESQPVGAGSPAENEFEPPLHPGTCLHERYIIQQQLGYGGFGRTYLAEDTGRFHEKFVIKEFMPSMKNTAALKKAEELFQREAEILHQLDHPQIPRFWEIFRQERQIFLVVDYVEGQTYKDLLEQRLQQGQCFSEIEILDLFQSLLPVLGYLHCRGVIHRDITPDNIILRIHDHLPVLIDMGGVKQVAMEVGTQTETGQNPTSITCLGKVGYAPPEQLLLGLVAPHSDLYALAVSALVLMTGKKPQLLNQDPLQWLCEQELKLSPLLRRTLNQMLAQKPVNRFQSADEVLQVLNLTFPTTLPKRYSGQQEIPPTALSGFPGQLGIPTSASRPPNGGQHKPTSLKQNWRAIPGSVKFLVLALLVIAWGVVYFFWKNHPISPSQLISAKLSLASDLQLRNSMREVQNVPPGLFNYGGAYTFAALNGHSMNDAISQAHPEFRLRYTEPLTNQPDSGTGIEMLLTGELSFTQSARPLEEDEYSKAKAHGFSLEQVPVAIDGVVFYTHQNLSIAGLSMNQLQAIFRGKVTNWQQLGGPDLPIVPVALDPKLTSSLKLLLGGQSEDLGRNVQIVRDFTAAIRKVAATPGGISYGSASIIIGPKTIRPIAVAKANTRQYVQPYTENRRVNAQAFQDGTYTMNYRLFIVFRRDGTVDEKAAVAYVNMLLSREGQAIIKQAGYVPLR